MAAGNWTEGQKAYAASVNNAIRVNGLTELVRAFRLLDPKLKRELQKELRLIAEPAAMRARNIALTKGISIFTVMGIRPGSRMGMAVVRQIRRATTHDHPAFGPFQIANVLEPAAVETMPEAAVRLEAMLDRIADVFNSGAD